MNSKKTRILYVMHVSWSWIKQRPHFIAENLADDYEVTILNEYSLRKGEKFHHNNLLFANIYLLPFSHLNKVFERISLFLYRFQIRLIIKKYDIIWFTAPLNYHRFSCCMKPTQKVVYDCMDDILEFSSNIKKMDLIKINEEKLYKRADVVFCSSDYLSGVMKNRYGDRDIVVINNAIDSKLLQPMMKRSISHPILKEYINDETNKIVYIGTISEWMDNSLLEIICKEIPSCSIYLWGPYKEGCNDTKHPTLHYCGKIDHQFLPIVMEHADVLIMPFIINKLILSVNPVKLYEYIASGKPCVAPLYGETEKFSDYVYLYSDIDNCVDIIRKIIIGEMGPKMDLNKCLDFATCNTWESRIDVIKKELERVQ